MAAASLNEGKTSVGSAPPSVALAAPLPDRQSPVSSAPPSAAVVAPLPPPSVAEPDGRLVSELRTLSRRLSASTLQKKEQVERALTRSRSQSRLRRGSVPDEQATDCATDESGCSARGRAVNCPLPPRSSFTTDASLLCVVEQAEEVGAERRAPPDLSAPLATTAPPPLQSSAGDRDTSPLYALSPSRAASPQQAHPGFMLPRLQAVGGTPRRAGPPVRRVASPRVVSPRPDAEEARFALSAGSLSPVSPATAIVSAAAFTAAAGLRGAAPYVSPPRAELGRARSPRMSTPVRRRPAHCRESPAELRRGAPAAAPVPAAVPAAAVQQHPAAVPPPAPAMLRSPARADQPLPASRSDQAVPPASRADQAAIPPTSEVFAKRTPPPPPPLQRAVTPVSADDADSATALSPLSRSELSAVVPFDRPALPRRPQSAGISPPRCAAASRPSPTARAVRPGLVHDGPPDQATPCASPRPPSGQQQQQPPPQVPVTALPSHFAPLRPLLLHPTAGHAVVHFADAGVGEEGASLLVLVGSSALYTFSAADGALHRCVPLQAVSEVLSVAGGVVGLRVPAEYDMLLRLDDAYGFCAAVSAARGAVALRSSPTLRWRRLEHLSSAELRCMLQLEPPPGWTLSVDAVIPLTYKQPAPAQPCMTALWAAIAGAPVTPPATTRRRFWASADPQMSPRRRQTPPPVPWPACGAPPE
eukprot:TRINITY_DN3890_c0_g1_i1.p1 TRINITY_DN3890_c0_g1~~TRINITY_DN3890_c0_g1_i1.p1  ORF type:complete len:720 (+),score=279.26 TRINITY_DN3890_c0_g1_i1:57-2162(+)